MKRTFLAVSLVAATSAPALAGSYLGLGIGTSPTISEQTDRLDGNGRSGKVLLGMRFGQLSLEGGIGAWDVVRTNDRGITQPFAESYQLSGALKLSLPLGNNFEAFGRAGLHHTWLRAASGMDRDHVSGDGYLIGAGFEYRLNLVVGQGSLFIDYQVNKAKLEGERFMFDGNTRMWTAGLTVGL
jgi:hypothetical protein